MEHSERFSLQCATTTLGYSKEVERGKKARSGLDALLEGASVRACKTQTFSCRPPAVCRSVAVCAVAVCRANVCTVVCVAYDCSTYSMRMMYAGALRSTVGAADGREAEGGQWMAMAKENGRESGWQRADGRERMGESGWEWENGKREKGGDEKC